MDPCETSIGQTTYSAQWWIDHYTNGGWSGAGSYGQLRDFKASVVNRVVKELGIRSICDFGCGDGSQASAFEVEKYHGYDLVRHKNFNLPFGDPVEADLTLSLDVAYHILEDEAYEQHIADLFKYARKAVLLYTMPDSSRDSPTHIKYRPAPEGAEVIPNDVDPDGCQFYLYIL